MKGDLRPEKNAAQYMKRIEVIKLLILDPFVVQSAIKFTQGTPK
jgi:hypothetical protein